MRRAPPLYPHRFVNIHAFVQRVADNIVKYGNVKYVTGTIPDGRDPQEVDAKILNKYGIAVSRWTRSRRLGQGQVSVHYVRHQNFFAMFAPEPRRGQSPWYELEEWSSEKQVTMNGSRILDVRRKPLVHGGYSIGFKHCTATGRDHVTVRIHPLEYRALKAHFLQLAVHRSAGGLSREFNQFPFEPWAGVRMQRWNIFQAVNAARRKAGFAQLETSCLRKKRIQHKLMVPEFASVPELRSNRREAA